MDSASGCPTLSGDNRTSNRFHPFVCFLAKIPSGAATATIDFLIVAVACELAIPPAGLFGRSADKRRQIILQFVQGLDIEINHVA